MDKNPAIHFRTALKICISQYEKFKCGNLRTIFRFCRSTIARICKVLQLSRFQIIGLCKILGLYNVLIHQNT